MSKEVGSIIRRARLQEGLSAKALGDECGVSGNEVYSIEVGRRDPKLVTLVRLGSVLGKYLVADVINQVKRENGL